MDSNGEQTAELQIAGAQNNGDDQKFICKVQTSAFPVAGSPASMVTAASNVYGMLIQALDLSTWSFLVYAVLRLFETNIDQSPHFDTIVDLNASFLAHKWNCFKSQF